jgi:hypothetical protein
VLSFLPSCLPELLRRQRAERGETSSVQLLEDAISIERFLSMRDNNGFSGDNGFLLSVYFIICHAPRSFHPKDSMNPSIWDF